MAHALESDLAVIACIGETLEEREAGSTEDVVYAQTQVIAGKTDVFNVLVLALIPVSSICTNLWINVHIRFMNIKHLRSSSSRSDRLPGYILVLV